MSFIELGEEPEDTGSQGSAALTRRQLRELETTRSRGSAARRSRKRQASIATAPNRSSTPAPAAPSLRKRVPAQILSFGTLVLAGALLVGMSVPADAFRLPESTAALTAADVPEQSPAQSLDAKSAATEEVAPIVRESWGVTTSPELLQLTFGRKTAAYTVDNSGPVRWPFPYAVPITDGFGARVSPCGGCSSQHKGTDFTPGAGVPIYAIADGVVSLKETTAWGFGNHVFIDHLVDGKKVTSVYAHMKSGSSTLKEGDVVKAGDLVGLVGTTGAVTGPHLHFEIRLGGTEAVDAFVWLKAHTPE